MFLLKGSALLILIFLPNRRCRWGILVGGWGTRLSELLFFPALPAWSACRSEFLAESGWPSLAKENAASLSAIPPMSSLPSRRLLSVFLPMSFWSRRLNTFPPLPAVLRLALL